MTTWSSEDFFGSSKDSAPSVTTKLPAVRKATPEEDELYRKRDPWERFKDAYTSSALHNPIGAEGAVRYLGVGRPKGVTDTQLNQMERILSDKYARKASADPALKGSAQLGAVNSVADFVGSLLGGVDPTYAIAPGRTAAQRIAAQAGVNASQDAAAQGIEIHRGVRDEFDPKETLLNLAVGAVVQGGGEGIRSHNLGRAVARGSSHPDWAAVNSVIVNDLEGGGSLAHPNVSKKGAMGPQQVMMATASKPGFDIRPWNGKTQADLARVGRQYSAAMMDKYDGDAAKVLAAYNAGPGRVDNLIKKHGDNWDLYLPRETKEYLHNGLTKLGHGEAGMLPRKPSSVVPMDPRDIARAMNDPEAAGLSSDQLAEAMPNNVTDLGQVRENLSNQKTSNLLDEKLNSAMEYEGAARDGETPLTPEQATTNREMAERMHSLLPEDHPYKEKTAQLLDVWRNTEQLLHSDRDPIGGKAPMDSSHEKFTRNPKENAPANVNTVGGKEPVRHWGEYTDSEWARLTNEEKQTALSRQLREVHPPLPSPEAIKLAQSRGVKGLDGLTRDEWADIEREVAGDRDTNPPASSSTFGTKHPESINPRSSAPPKGEDHEDLKAIKTQKKLVLDKLGDVLDQSTPVRREAEAAMAKERARRLAAAYSARKDTGGQEGLYKALGALKGEMGRPKIHSIRDQFTPDEINQLHDIVWNSPALTGYEPIRAGKALDKLLGEHYGEIPTPSDTALLAKAMPRNAKFWKQLLENQEGSIDLPDTPLKKAVIGVLNTPKTLMASYDISAPLRQGVFMVGRKEFYTSLAPMVRSLVSPKYERGVKEAIFRDPLFEEMRSSGLAVPADVGHNGGPRLAEMEEAYQTQLAQKIPLIGIGVRASERAYTTFIYKLRADTFKALYNAGEQSGKTWDPKSLHDLSRFINTFTGRGSLGKFNNMSPQLNTIFFSPRLLKSRIDAINILPGGFYHKLDPFVRKEAFKSILSFATVAATIMGLAHLAGAEVDPDPRHPDGWKIKIGNTRHDILGGEQQLIRLMTNVGQYTFKAGKELATTGKLKKGNPYKDRTAITNIGQFLRNKESPDVSFFHDFAAGNNAIGEDFELKKEALSRVTPMAPSDVYDSIEDLKNKGVPTDKAIIKGVLSTLDAWPGVSVQTYPPKTKKSSGGDFGFKKSDFGGATWSSKDFQ